MKFGDTKLNVEESLPVMNLTYKNVAWLKGIPILCYFAKCSLFQAEPLIFGVFHWIQVFYENKWELSFILPKWKGYFKG